MIDTLRAFAGEVTRVAREVGTEGSLGGQADVPGVSGTWKDLTDNVNTIASNLTDQVRNIAVVTTAVANGDLSQKITVDVQGEMLELKNTINTMVDQLRSFADEVTRVAKEVGTRRQARRSGRACAGVVGHVEGPHRQREPARRQPHRPGAQHRRRDDRGREGRPLAEDHGRRARRDPRAQEHHQHDGRPAPLVRGRGHARRARGRHRGQARRPGARARACRGTWKDLTDNVNSWPSNLTGQVRNIAEVDHRGRARATSSRKITVDVKGEILELKNTINTMVDQLSLVRRRGHARRARGRHRGQARRSGRRARASRHVEGPHRQRQQLADNLTSQVRNIAEVTTAVAQGDLLAEDHRRRARRDRRAQGHDQHDGRPALRRSRRRSRASRRRSAPKASSAARRRCRACSGAWRDLTDNVNQLAGIAHHAGARDRRGLHRGDRRATSRARSPSRRRARSRELKDNINQMIANLARDDAKERGAGLAQRRTSRGSPG